MTLVPDGYMVQTKTEFDPRFRENGCIPFTTQQIDALSEKYLAGSRVKDLADEYGIHPGTVVNMLKKIGVEIRPRGRARHVTPQVIEDALTARALGADWPEVQAMLGVTWESMAQNIRAERRAQRLALEAAAAEVESLRRQLAEQEERAHRAEMDVSSLRGTCAALGKIISEHKARADDAERGFQATQRSLSWIMHHRAVGIEGMPGWVLNNLKRTLKREQEPIRPLE